VRLIGLINVASDDPSTRAELLLLSASFLVPYLTHNGINIWDTLAIGEYLNEILPAAGLLPEARTARARCRSISGEMHSGFSNLPSALPMNLKAHHSGFKVWAGAQADINRIISIWRECLAAEKGPYLFGASPCMADAMFALVVTRFLSYDVKLDSECAAYCATIMAMPPMQEWVAAAKAEPDEVLELDVEFCESRARAPKRLSFFQPIADPFHSFIHFSGGARVTETQKVSAIDRIEIDARSCGNAGLVQHAFGKVETVV